MYKEMDDAIILNVPGLIEKRFPDELFHRLRDPQGDITVVDPLGDESRPASATNAVDFQCTTDACQAQDGSLIFETAICADHMMESSGVDNRQLKEIGGHDKEPPSAPMSTKSISDVSSCSGDSMSRSSPHPSTSSSNTSFEPQEPLLTVNDIFNHLCGTEPLYDVEQKKWADWPDITEQKKQHEIADRLNKILGRVQEYLYDAEEGDDDWIFSVEQSKTVDDPTAGAENSGTVLEEVNLLHKPGLALVRRGSKGGLGWRDARAFGEVKFTDYSLLQLAKESCECIREMQSVNALRRFALLFSLVKTKMTLIKYDRAGVLVSVPFDINEEPMRFLRVLVGMAFGEDYYLGLDPSFWSKGEKDYITFEDTNYEIEKVIHAGSDVRGRGTIALLVIHPITGRRYVIKDQWVDRSREIKEVDILNRLKGKKLKVNQLVRSSIVAFRVGSGATLPDSTEPDRQGLKKKILRNIEVRDHYRLLLAPYGENITRFRCLRELVSSFKDYAEGKCRLTRSSSPLSR